MALSLSWTENKYRKYGKENGNYQTTKTMRHLTTEHIDAEEMEADITVSKSKIEAKKEEIKRSLLSSYDI